MEQDNIYRVLLELKETSGRIEAKVETIKETAEELAFRHNKLQEAHSELKESHNSLKGKVLWVSGLVGTIFGAFTAWLKIEWNKIFN